MWGCDWKLPSPHSILNLPASALSHVSEKRALLVQDSARLHSPSPRQVTLISREELFLAEARGVSPAHALRSFLRRRPWDITGWSPSGCPAGAVGLLTLPLRFGVGPLSRSLTTSPVFFFFFFNHEHGFLIQNLNPSKFVQSQWQVTQIQAGKPDRQGLTGRCLPPSRAWVERGGLPSGWPSCTRIPVHPGTLRHQRT